MIAEMKKVQIAGLASQKNKVLREIQKLGVMQVVSSDYSENDSPDASEFVQHDEAGNDVLEVEKKLNITKETIEFFEKILAEHNIKLLKPFAADDEFTQDFNELVWLKICKLQALMSQYTDNMARQNSLRHELSEISVWSKLDCPLDLHKTEKTVWYIGTIPNSSDISVFNSEIEKINLCHCIVAEQDKTQRYILVVAHISAEDDVIRLLHKNSFKKADLSGVHGTASENIKNISNKLSTLDDENKKIESYVIRSKKDLDDFKKLYDYLLNLEKRHHIRKNLLRTQETFFITGYVAAENFNCFTDSLSEKFKVAIEELPADEDEKPPVLFKNYKFVAPFEMVTKMFSMPDPKEADPNFILSIFYSLFFGLMMADAGYGIVMCVLSFLAIKFSDLSGVAAKLVRLLFICGLSTIFWGIVFGGWFGNFFDVMLSKPEGFAVWFNPLEEPMKMLVFSFILGVIHLLAGMAMKAYILIRSGKVWDAVFDVGFWYLLYAGIGMMLFESTSGIGKYVLIAGVAGLILTQGRHEKNIFMKLFKGVASLYGIVGFFSDVLSYSRVLALALASAVIAMVVNTMGSLAGTSTIGGILIFTVAFLIGHTFNLAIGALGAYVHSSRLQYVEFFGKFYSGGGKEFKPFSLSKFHTTSKR